MRDYAAIRVEKHGVRSTTCDSCGKTGEGEPEGWVHVNYGHADWQGAGEEDEARDACCAICLSTVLRKIAADYENEANPTLSVWLGSLPYEVIRDLGKFTQ